MNNTENAALSSGDAASDSTSCTTADVSVPPGANHVEPFEGGERYVAADLGGGQGGSVSVTARQLRDGTLVSGSVELVILSAADRDIPPEQVRDAAVRLHQLARLVVVGGELAEQWRVWAHSQPVD